MKNKVRKTTMKSIRLSYPHLYAQEPKVSAFKESLADMIDTMRAKNIPPEQITTAVANATAMYALGRIGLNQGGL